MNSSYIIPFLILLTLSIFLLVKYINLCSNIEEIKNMSKRKSGVYSKPGIMYLYRTNNPIFREALQKSIYSSLYEIIECVAKQRVEDCYQHKYKEWRKVCDNNGWEFPALLAELDTAEKFKEVFFIK